MLLRCPTHRPPALPCPAQLVELDFGRLGGIEDQIREVRQADVLAGYHGAALTLALFMPWQSGLVEVQEEWR